MTGEAARSIACQWFGQMERSMIEEYVDLKTANREIYAFNRSCSAAFALKKKYGANLNLTDI